jgi:hypothetical protein
MVVKADTCLLSAELVVGVGSGFEPRKAGQGGTGVRNGEENT